MIHNTYYMNALKYACIIVIVFSDSRFVFLSLMVGNKYNHLVRFVGNKRRFVDFFLTIFFKKIKRTLYNKYEGSC